MTPDDDLSIAIGHMQRHLRSTRTAMKHAVDASAPEERWRHQRVRIKCQLAMLEAAQEVFRLATSPEHQGAVSSSEISRLEEEWGFDPGTYGAILEEPQGERAVLVEGNLAMALAVTRAEYEAIEAPDTGSEFVEAVIRICFATAVGALVGAPLGALAAQENILRKVAEAAVVTCIGATTTEVIERFSVEVPRGPAEPSELDQAQSFRLAMDAMDDFMPGALVIPDDVPNPDIDEPGRRSPRGPSGPGSWM